VQCAPGRSIDPQEWVWLKSAAFVPVNIMLLRFSVSPLALESVTVCEGLLVPTSWSIAEDRFG
jgi:hypothetical protein